MNRFSNDIGLADRLLPFTSQEFLQFTFSWLTFLVFISYSNVLVMILGIVAFLALSLLVRYCKKSINQTRIVELTLRNPISSLFSETINQLVTIRTYNLKQHFIILQRNYLNQWNKANTVWWVTARFLFFYGKGCAKKNEI